MRGVLPLLERPRYSRLGCQYIGVKPVNRFEIIIFWSDEDQACVADVPELPGCMSGTNLP